MMLRVDLRALHRTPWNRNYQGAGCVSKHELSGITCHVQNCSLRKTLSAVRMNDRTAIPATPIQMPAICLPQLPARSLSPDTNAPLSHEFCGPAINPHLESLGHSSRWLLVTFYRVCFLQARSNFLKRGGFLPSVTRRFRKTLAG